MNLHEISASTLHTPLELFRNISHVPVLGTGNSIILKVFHAWDVKTINPAKRLLLLNWMDSPQGSRVKMQKMFGNHPGILLLLEEFLHQLIGSLSHYLQGFIHPRLCRMSSINSRNIAHCSQGQGWHFANQLCQTRRFNHLKGLQNRKTLQL